jgi:hypothetical protein
MAHPKTTGKQGASGARKPAGKENAPKSITPEAGSAKPQKQGTKAKAKK